LTAPEILAQSSKEREDYSLQKFLKQMLDKGFRLLTATWDFCPHFDPSKKIFRVDSSLLGGDSVGITAGTRVRIAGSAPYSCLSTAASGWVTTRARKHNCLPTVKLTLIFHSSAVRLNMNCGAIDYSIVKVQKFVKLRG